MNRPDHAWRLLLPALLALGCGVARDAHAGMFEFIDDMFTFREDQKARVAPRRVLPPKEVQVPYYDSRDHAAWSNYYTREDLTAQTYQDGSASKIMRPAPEARRQDMAYGGPSRGGWQTIEDRGYANDMAAQSGDVYIGEPGQGPGMAVGDSRVGRQTVIGAPVEDWRKEGNVPLSSRPGDYDYRAPVGETDGWYSRDEANRVPGRRATASVNDLADRARSAGDVATHYDAPDQWRNDPRYVGFNDKGQVTKYKVQRGDTLSNIAGQDAIYNNWKLWPLIYSANRRAIGRDPDNLKLDQRLGIPRGYSDAQAKDAMRKGLSRAPGRAGDGR